MKKIHSLLISILTLSLLAGCGAASGGNTASAGNTQTVSGTEIQFSDSKLTASSTSGVTIDGTALTITALHWC